MGWKVRYKERTGKYAQWPPEEQAKLIYTWRYTEHKTWVEIGKLIELSGSAAAKLMQRHGYDLLEAPKGSILKFAARNAKIMEIANDNYANGISSELSIVDAMKEAGYDGVTVQVVRAVIYRAREAGRPAPPAKDIIRKPKPSGGHPWAGQGIPGLEPEPLPPRTPELMVKARVPWESVGELMCRYTPSEESPFMFCGEPVMAHSSWCQDCYDRIIKRPPEEAVKARRNNALRLEQRAKH